MLLCGTHNANKGENVNTHNAVLQHWILFYALLYKNIVLQAICKYKGCPIKNDPPVLFAKMSITTDTFTAKFYTHTHIQHVYTY